MLDALRRLGARLLETLSPAPQPQLQPIPVRTNPTPRAERLEVHRCLP